MALPALSSQLSELEQEIVEAVAPSPSESGTRAPIEELSKQTKKIERLLIRIRPTVAEMFAAVEESVKAVGSGGQDLAIEYMDRAIEQVGARESALARQLLPMIEALRKLRAQTFRVQNLSREEKARNVLVMERQAKALGAILSLFRDERWRMMTLRAEIEPAGDAPAFSDPKELEAYLDKL